MTSLPEPISKEEFTNLANEKQKLDNLWRIHINMSSEEWKEHDERVNEINKQLGVQRFIHNLEYFEEIKNLIAHPKLEGIISWHGLTLIEEFW